MEKKLFSPRIKSLSWGDIHLEGGRTFKDAKLYPGGLFHSTC